MAEKLTFQDFLASVAGEERAFAADLHEELSRRGCQVAVKLAKSGYVVSYSHRKRTIANVVCRKKGLAARLYLNHIAQYEALLETLPEEMLRLVQEAPVCKRLLDPEACNPKCATGFDFQLRGERLQKCRNGAFMFPLSAQTRPFVRALLIREAEAGE